MRKESVGLRVGVVHGPGARIRPVWFDLNRKKHNIREITNVWRDRCGETQLVHFNVTDEGALYELVYNLTTTSWYCSKINLFTGNHMVSASYAGSPASKIPLKSFTGQSLKTPQTKYRSLLETESLSFVKIGECISGNSDRCQESQCQS